MTQREFNIRAENGAARRIIRDAGYKYRSEANKTCNNTLVSVGENGVARQTPGFSKKKKKKTPSRVDAHVYILGRNSTTSLFARLAPRK